ncbi:thioredoxin-disulfide reductase [Candidatus Sneabacter namystus]|uniref:Thioredoxin reductase n=2 Tax=Candidatus Sneabacter namystus TaxID=2601646 RepID=A0A5C0UJ67_9RICK|nr:thioredoxin-disulfide reductase [Candidatus Sneabacter namystus]
MEQKVLIIGSGPAGCTAALYCARFGLEPLMFLGRQEGGQLSITTDVENYPGFIDGVLGPDLMSNMIKQAQRFGTKTIARDIKKICVDKRPFAVIDDTDEKHSAQSIIITTGAQAKWLGLESEKRYLGFGVSSCATCDGFFFKDQDVIVVGGGNTAVEEALYLNGLVRSVTLIHRRNTLRAEKIMQERLFREKKVRILWNSVLKEVIGDGKSVTGARIADVTSGDEREINVQGIFIAIGHSPNTSLVKGQINCDSEGYILTKANSTQTNIPGVFAAGDVQDKIFRQAVTAAGTGCMAAIEAEKFLSS